MKARSARRRTSDSPGETSKNRPTMPDAPVARMTSVAAAPRTRAAPGESVPAMRPLHQLVSREDLEDLEVAPARALDDLLRKRRHWRLLVPADGLEPIAHELLVVGG